MAHETLGEELWLRIEAPQGFAYLSDAQTEMQPDDAKVVLAARGALRFHRECIRILEDFLSRVEKEKQPR